MENFLKLKNKLTGFLILLVLITGCGEKEQKKNYVARVNDSYLTEEDLTAISGGYGGQKFFKEEIIHNWVKQELLYQKARETGILESDNYKNVVRNSERQLAAAMMIEKIFSEITPQFKLEELKDYFKNNGDIFRLSSKAFIINIAEFTDEDKAVSFRSAAVESEWNKALNFFSLDKMLKNSEVNKLVFLSDLMSPKITRILKELNPGEVSLIINEGEEDFMIVKLVEKLEPGAIPPFEIIKEDVEKRFIALKKAEILEKYFEELYSENEIDVKPQEF